MATYLVEAYLSRTEAAGSPWNDVWLAAEASTLDGHEVHLVKSIFVPEDEICFYLFEAESWAYVMETAFRSGMQIERLMNTVTESVSGAFDPLTTA
jgi:hypothetical protein